MLTPMCDEFDDAVVERCLPAQSEGVSISHGSRQEPEVTTKTMQRESGGEGQDYVQALRTDFYKHMLNIQCWGVGYGHQVKVLRHPVASDQGLLPAPPLSSKSRLATGLSPPSSTSETRSCLLDSNIF